MSSSVDAKRPARSLPHFQRLTPRVPVLNVWTSETSHFRPFLHERHYLFTVPTFPTELLKRTLLGSGFPTQNSYVQFLRRAPWHPAWETEGRIVQAPIYTTMTSRKQLFSVGYFQHFRCLFRIKEDGRISHAALDHQKCESPYNRNIFT